MENVCLKNHFCPFSPRANTQVCFASFLFVFLLVPHGWPLSTRGSVSHSLANLNWSTAAKKEEKSKMEKQEPMGQKTHTNPSEMWQLKLFLVHRQNKHWTIPWLAVRLRLKIHRAIVYCGSQLPPSTARWPIFEAKLFFTMREREGLWLPLTHKAIIRFWKFLVKCPPTPLSTMCVCLSCIISRVINLLCSLEFVKQCWCCALLCVCVCWIICLVLYNFRV